MLGVVFTDDPDFCSRRDAPMHVTEFTMSQIDFPSDYIINPNTIYNATTWPGIPYEFSRWQPDDLPPGSDVVGFRTACALAGSPEGGKSFREASWLIEPQDSQNVETASVVRVRMHVKNSAQELAWTLDAKRCDAVMKYFQNLAGNHIYPTTIDCVRNFKDTEVPQKYVGPPVNTGRALPAVPLPEVKVE